jgi:hypothetical protein
VSWLLWDTFIKGARCRNTWCLSAGAGPRPRFEASPAYFTSWQAGHRATQPLEALHLRGVVVVPHLVALDRPGRPRPPQISQRWPASAATRRRSRSHTAFGTLLRTLVYQQVDGTSSTLRRVAPPLPSPPAHRSAVSSTPSLWRPLGAAAVDGHRPTRAGRVPCHLSVIPRRPGGDVIRSRAARCMGEVPNRLEGELALGREGG